MTDTITEIPNLDFTGDRLEVGDTTELVEKLNRMQDKLEAFTQAVNANRSDLSATLSAQADEMILAIQNEQLNYIPSHGTFLEPVSSSLEGVSGYATDQANFSPRGLNFIIQSFNGSNLDTAEESDRSIYRSSSVGGTNPPHSELITAFIEKIRNSQTLSQFMPPFAIAKIRSGAGTSGATYNGRYSWFHTNRLTHMSGPHGGVSFSYYFQALDGDAYTVGFNLANPLQQFVDGVRLSHTEGVDGTQYHLLEQGKIYHIAGYHNLSPISNISSAVARTLILPNTECNIALPWATNGAFQMLPHSRPARSYNTVGEPLHLLP